MRAQSTRGGFAYAKIRGSGYTNVRVRFVNGSEKRKMRLPAAATGLSAASLFPLFGCFDIFFFLFAFPLFSNHPFLLLAKTSRRLNDSSTGASSRSIVFTPFSSAPSRHRDGVSVEQHSRELIDQLDSTRRTTGTEQSDPFDDDSISVQRLFNKKANQVIPFTTGESNAVLQRPRVSLETESNDIEEPAGDTLVISPHNQRQLP